MSDDTQPTMEQMAELTELVILTNRVSAKLAVTVSSMAENIAKLTERQVRMETRLVKLATHLGLDANGDKRS